MNATRRPRLVVVGNGMAAIRVVELLIEQAPALYDITIFDAEAHGSYNRILLSPVLAGEKVAADIITHPAAWYAERSVTLHSGDPVVSIHRRNRLVQSRNGVEVEYDRLLIATGSTPAILPVPGNELPGVIGFRNLQDVDAMIATARHRRYAAVIGGGLLGIEAANGLSRRGMTVILVHRSQSLLNQQLDAPAAALLRTSLQARKLDLRLNTQTSAILGRERVSGVRFKDGPDATADLVIMAVGIRPNVELAKRAGIHCDRAIVVDDTMQTFDPRIYAVGECTQHRGATYGLVAPLWEQARVCAMHLARFGYSRYAGSLVSAKLKVTGIDLYSAGDFIGGAGTEDLVLRDPYRGVYRRLVVSDSRLVGAILYGDVTDAAWYFDLIKARSSIASFRDLLIFGRSYCEAA